MMTIDFTEKEIIGTEETNEIKTQESVSALSVRRTI